MKQYCDNFCSLLPTPYSRLPTPDSRLPTPDSLLPTPFAIRPSRLTRRWDCHKDQTPARLPVISNQIREIG
ncbi:MAG: hypothetical protein F6K37_35705 [Moorea sp. SIO4E2]|uniref:hypothetical protein n=1 Tax=Moorena sp. SIO4E2 TaxID=2607826 RepID=UPI0013B6DDA9|nr:hypothetical protein [Moorena sp. SIO4E2]NEQ11064.1 hypothetical protein [Moorena sp. SIO4E2]